MSKRERRRAERSNANRSGLSRQEQVVGVCLAQAVAVMPGLLGDSLLRVVCVIDVIGSESRQRAADQLIAVGVVAAAPTAVTGLSDWAALRA